MTDEYDNAEICERGGDLVRRTDQVPQARGGNGNYVPVFVGGTVPLPKVRELSPAEIREVDEDEDIYTGTPRNETVTGKKSVYEILGSIVLVAFIVALLYFFFPRNLIGIWQDDELIDLGTKPSKKLAEAVTENPEAVALSKSVWVKLEVLVSTGRNSEACAVGASYWKVEHYRSDRDWLNAWIYYLKALDGALNQEELKTIASILNMHFPDNLNVAHYYTKSLLREFESIYPSIEGAENKKQNAQTVADLMALLDRIKGVSRVAFNNLSTSEKNMDNAERLMDYFAVSEARAVFYQWKLDEHPTGGLSWDVTLLERALQCVEKNKSPAACKFRKDVGVYCYTKWGYNKHWRRSINGKKYSAQKFQAYLEN